VGVLISIVVTVALASLALVLLSKLVTFAAAAAMSVIPALIVLWFIVFVLSRMVRSLLR